VSNKVRPTDPGAGDVSGPQLIMGTLSTASIQDPAATLRSRRYLATMRADHTGWRLSINGRDDTHGPFATAQDAYDWYMAHRDNVPPGKRPPRRHTDWPPGSPWDVDDE
jgi:hypothetical protein